MRKVAVARCAFVVLTLSMLAVSGADKTVTNKEGGYEIAIPESWVRSFCGDLTCVYSGSTEAVDEMKCKINVSPFAIKGGTELKAFVERFAPKAKDSRFYEFVGETIATKVANFNAYKVTFKKTFGFPNSLSLNYYFIAEERGFTIEITMRRGDYDKYAKELDAIVKSFKLIEAK